MKPLITAQQINKFTEYGWIEFEEFLPIATCDQLLKTLGSTPYLEGRDCYRKNPELTRLLTRGALPSTVSHLVHQKILLLGFDQWIPAHHTFSPLHMQAHFSFQNIACGALLLLDEQNKGSVRFFMPERLPVLASAPQLLIAYATPRSVYFHNSRDPLNTDLKRFGYHFGDKINPEHHPLCIIS